jgi:hypothetical protein
MTARVVSLVLALGLVIVSTLSAFMGFIWGFGLKCDDACGTPPPWRESRDAWQWDALGTVAVSGLVCALAFLAVLALQLRSAAFVALAVWTALGVGLLALFRDSGVISDVQNGWVGLGVLVVVGISSIVLMPARKQQRLTRG